MSKSYSKYKKLIIFHIVTFIVLDILIVVEVLYLNHFNTAIHSVVGTNSDIGVYMTLNANGNGTSEWVKRNFMKDGRETEIGASTFSGNLTNGSKYTLDKWKLRLNIKEDCYINSAWCGTVEIHQNVRTEEKVQRLDLRNYRTGDIRLEYYYDGDLLIPLHEGDYVIYYPSAKDGEYYLESGGTLGTGCIFYYYHDLDLTDYELTFNFDRRFYEGHQFYVLLILYIAWSFSMTIIIATHKAKKRTILEMEMKKSGILSMSDMYSLIYIVDLLEDELIPLVEDEENEKRRANNQSAKFQLDTMFKLDCDDMYKNLAAEMCDVEGIKKRLADGSTFAFEYVSKTSGWRRIRLFPMEGEAGQQLGKVIFTVQDINDEKAWIEEIQQRIDTVEHENKEKSVFLANMSHEIRTPINTVIGLDTMILRETKEPTVRSYAKSINSAANMLLSLINGILDISKLEANKMELVNEEYSFKSMLKEVVGMVKMRNEFERLEFVCDISPNIANSLKGDEVRLKQVIINLLTNAAKYTDQGTIKLSAFGKEHEGMMHLLISVKDTGTGIKEEDLKKLADRYQRFDSKRNHKVEGTGIGLNLVTGILDLMDSELHVLSQYGEGSEFYFELEQEIVSPEPIGQFDLEEEMEEEESYQSLFTAPDAKVLVVDDNAMNLTVFVELLKETELQIDTASSGFKALEMADSVKYDLIFMDHMMPEMDGVETFGRLREKKDGPNAKTPVIILTANALKGAKEEYDRIGFDDFLAKPIQPDSLEEMVLKHLDSSKVKKSEKVKKKEKTVSLPVIQGVDVAYGLEHTGGMGNYMSLLNQFGAVAESDLEELESYVAQIKEDGTNKDAISSYRIKVHAMKSSANILGALRVYGVAATLEELATKEDAEGICAIMPYFGTAWSELVANVKASLPETEKKKDLPDKETLDQLLHLLETSIKAYDIKNSDELVHKLSEFDWGEENSDLVKQLEVAVANLDAEKVVSICEEISRKINN